MSASVPEATLDDIFRPPPKGDITLRSSDGVEFQAHTAILSMASSVFDSLCVVGTNRDVVEVSENAATMSLVLRFIYPNKKMPIMPSFEVLSLCLHAAQKYDLEGMLETIDDQLAMKTTSQSLAHQDPLRAYELALQYNLPNTRALATPLVITGAIDFSNPARLSELVQSHPPASVIRLTATQSTRGKMLADVLFHFYKQPISPPPEHSDMFYKLSCAPCRKWLESCDENPDRSGLRKQNPPSWLLCWIDLAYGELLRAPLEKSDEIFECSIMARFKGKNNVCQSCIGDFQTLQYRKRIFNEWAQSVKSVLKQRLEAVQQLYAL